MIVFKSSNISLKFFKRYLNIFGLVVSISERLYKDLQISQPFALCNPLYKGGLGFSNNCNDRENLVRSGEGD